MERELTVNEGRTALYMVGPSSGTGAPVLVLHSWWGLNDDVRGFARRLADAGFNASAPDLYGGKLATTVEEAERLSNEMDEDFADAAALAALDALLAGSDARRAAAIGFSLGAMFAVWLPGVRPEVVASVAYYGAVWGPRMTPSGTPVLGHFGEADQYETAENIAAFEKASREAGRELTLHRYPGAGHWFAEPSQETYMPREADLAFERTVEFLRRHLSDR